MRGLLWNRKCVFESTNPNRLISGNRRGWDGRTATHTIVCHENASLGPDIFLRLLRNHFCCAGLCGTPCRSAHRNNELCHSRGDPAHHAGRRPGVTDADKPVAHRTHRGHVACDSEGRPANTLRQSQPVAIDLPDLRLRDHLDPVGGHTVRPRRNPDNSCSCRCPGKASHPRVAHARAVNVGPGRWQTQA